MSCAYKPRTSNFHSGKPSSIVASKLLKRRCSFLFCLVNLVCAIGANLSFNHREMVENEGGQCVNWRQRVNYVLAKEGCKVLLMVNWPEYERLLFSPSVSTRSDQPCRQTIARAPCLAGKPWTSRRTLARVNENIDKQW